MTKKTSQLPKKQMRQDIFVSVVVVPRKEFTGMLDYCRALSAVLVEAYANYEIIVVDNAMMPERVNELVGLLDELPCIRIIRLSREHSYDIAVIAGLEGSIGDYTIITDPSLDYIDNILQIVEINQRYDIVQGVAKVSTKKFLKSGVGRRLFYWYNRRYLSINIPVQSTYLIALSRRSVRALTTTARHDGYIRHMIKIVGYSYGEFKYKTKVDPLRSRSLRTGVVEALDVVSSHSTHPLRFMSWVGFFASLLNIGYLLYIVIVALTKQHIAEGWTTMSLQISGMFFILFVFMVVLSEYIGKILNESRHDARYYVLDELSSTVSLADVERKNISN